MVDLYNQTQNQTTITIDPNDCPKLDGTQIPEQSKPVVIGTPIQKQDKEAAKLADPIYEQDKNAGIYVGSEIEIGDWRDFILTNQDKPFVDYKGDVNKGDQIDLSKFTDRQKASGGKANMLIKRLARFFLLTEQALILMVEVRGSLLIKKVIGLQR